MANSLKICNECHNKPVRCKGLCANCYQRSIMLKHKAQSGISITRLQKGWTRHGGSNRSYQIPEVAEDWVCQACAQKQPSQLPAYLFPFMDTEVIRICASCHNLVVQHNIKEFYILRHLVRF